MKNSIIECSACHSKLLSPTTKSVSRAYDQYRSRVSSKQRFFNTLLVVGDCMLVGLQVLLFLPFPFLNSLHIEKVWVLHFGTSFL